MNVGVVGYGSIGTRHARILDDLGHDVFVVSRRDESPFMTYRDLQQLLNSRHIDYLVIATPTGSHHQDLTTVSACGFRGRLLVEKPLLATTEPLPRLAVTRGLQPSVSSDCSATPLPDTHSTTRSSCEISRWSTLGRLATCSGLSNHLLRSPQSRGWTIARPQPRARPCKVSLR